MSQSFLLTLIRLISVLFELMRMIYGRQLQRLFFASVKPRTFLMVNLQVTPSWHESSGWILYVARACVFRRQSSCYKVNTKING